MSKSSPYLAKCTKPPQHNNNNRETKKLFVVRIIQKPQRESMDKKQTFECYRCPPIGFKGLKKELH